MKKIRNLFVVLGGSIYLLLGLFHTTFWKMFDWEKELTKLSQVNSNLMQMLNIGITIMVISLGIILIIYRKEVQSSKLGRALLIVSFLFFLGRMIAEFYFPGGSTAFGMILLLVTLVYLFPAVYVVKEKQEVVSTNKLEPIIEEAKAPVS
jgi:hypothetical protein